MAKGFYITETGRNLLTQAAADESKVVISKIKVGDGATTQDEPNPSLTALKNEVYEKEFDPDYDRYFIDDQAPNILEITCGLTNDVGDFMINEVGFCDVNDNIILYGVIDPTPKHKGEGGLAWTMDFTSFIEFESQTDLDLIGFTIELGNIAELEQDIRDVQRQLEEMIIYACDSEDIREIVGDINLPYEDYKPDFADEEDIDNMFD